MRKKVIFVTSFVVGLSLCAALLLLPSCNNSRPQQSRSEKARNETSALSDSLPSEQDNVQWAITQEEERELLSATGSSAPESALPEENIKPDGNTDMIKTGLGSESYIDSTQNPTETSPYNPPWNGTGGTATINNGLPPSLSTTEAPDGMVGGSAAGGYGAQGIGGYGNNGGMGGMMGGMMGGSGTGGMGMGGGFGGRGAAGGYGAGMMGGADGVYRQTLDERAQGGRGARGSTVNRIAPSVGDIPLIGGLFRNDGRRLTPSQIELSNQLLRFSADELWIIAKVDTSRPVVSDDRPGTGSMLVKLPRQTKEIPLPLKHTDVKGDIYGYIATVEVTQQFQNPYSEKIEANYVFPLPQNAAVNEFIMTIGDRKIRGIIRERQEAEQIYQQARDQGYVASLLTQERPNIFTQKVANIEPSKQIDVNIKYFSTLAYVDGWYEFVFPMVVGPRYNPPGTTDGVGAVAHGRTGASGQSTEVQYLRPNQRSGHDISIAVNIDAGVEIEEIKSPTHVITKRNIDEENLTVKLNELDNIPNKDFVLRYKVAGKQVKSALMTHRDERGGYFSLMLYPPESLKSVQRAPMEMIFVLDCSGSMNGKPIEKAKDAINRALRQLQPNDTFQIIRFSNNASQFGPKPLPATRENVQRGLDYVAKLNGTGGTQMIEGVRAALDFEHDPERFRLVSFMTDGYIGNEADILEAVHDKLGASRIFSFGIGSSVNRFLLDRMAMLGKGAVAYIGLDEDGGEIIDKFYERISHPALTDVEIDWGSLEVAEVYPSKIPDLFVGRPVILTGKFKGNSDTTIKVRGNVGSRGEEISIAVNLDNASATHPGIACVWARKQIETLNNISTYDNSSEIPTQIKQVALDYGLMSSYTAFIAVDSSRQTMGDHGLTVNVPVPVPYGVRYDTTVQQ